MGSSPIRVVSGSIFFFFSHFFFFYCPHVYMYLFYFIRIFFYPFKTCLLCPALILLLSALPSSYTPPAFRCLFRVLDSFGTEPQFNFKSWKPVPLTQKQEYGKAWGNWDLNPRQFMTMFRKSGLMVPVENAWLDLEGLKTRCGFHTVMGGIITLLAQNRGC